MAPRFRTDIVPKIQVSEHREAALVSGMFAITILTVLLATYAAVRNIDKTLQHPNRSASDSPAHLSSGREEDQAFKSWVRQQRRNTGD